ncbi:hypothetical protein, partial [Streptomyces sp. P17]|uniref:hypothetical protein n=1 Tax=Streptomyces sp. P17 TaxID=3074716 RepID=UPI0028F41AAD
RLSLSGGWQVVSGNENHNNADHAAGCPTAIRHLDIYAPSRHRLPTHPLLAENVTLPLLFPSIYIINVEKP